MTKETRVQFAGFRNVSTIPFEVLVHGVAYPRFPGAIHPTIEQDLGKLERTITVDVIDSDLLIHYLRKDGIDILEQDYKWLVSDNGFQERLAQIDHSIQMYGNRPREVSRLKQEKADLREKRRTHYPIFQIGNKLSLLSADEIHSMADTLQGEEFDEFTRFQWVMDEDRNIYFGLPTTVEPVRPLPDIKKEDCLVVSSETNGEIAVTGGNLVYLDRAELRRAGQITREELMTSDPHIPDKLLSRLNREGLVDDNDYMNIRLNDRFWKALPIDHPSGHKFVCIDWGSKSGKVIVAQHSVKVTDYVPDHPYMLTETSNLSNSIDRRLGSGFTKGVDVSDFAEVSQGVWRSNFGVGFAVNRHRGILYKLEESRVQQIFANKPMY
jgi:hypothetical protein